MARGKTTNDLSTLRMALVGYEIEKQRIDDKIREIQAHLKGRMSPASHSGPEKKAARVKRVLSPAARKRIAAAQRKRWAEHRRRLAAGGKQE